MAPLRPVLVGLALVVVLVLFWPQMLGGGTSYVVVSGVSMEPTLSTGDLVVTRQHGSYDIGDVVAFKTDKGDVIHRIVGGDANAGYVIQGDNKPDVDRWRPTPASIRGSQWFQVPKLGTWLLATTRVVPLPVLGGIGAFLAVGGVSRRHRRRRRIGKHEMPRHIPRTRHTRPTRRTHPEDAAMKTTAPSRTRIRVAAGAGLMALLLAPSAIVAWRTPTSETVPAVATGGAQHQLALDVTGIAGSPGLIYPSGRSETIAVQANEGEVVLTEAIADQADAPAAGAFPASAPPLFSALIDELRVGVRYELVGATETRGVIAVGASIMTGRGFVMDMPGLATTEFEGAFDGALTVDLQMVDRRVAEYVAAAGISADSANVVLTPVVTVDAATAGGGIEQATFTGGSLQISRGSDLIEIDGMLRTVQDVAAGTAGVATARATTSKVLGLGVDTTIARWSTAGVLAALLLLAGWLLRRDNIEHPETRIGMLYRSIMVDIAPTSEPGGDIVQVSSMAELARLARRDHRSILHQVRPDGAHRYLVPDVDLTYEYSLGMEADAQVDIPDDVSGIVIDVRDGADGPSGAPSATNPPEDHAPEDDPSENVRIIESPRAITVDLPAAATAPEPAPVARVAPDPDRVVVVRSFSELSRLWMNSTNPPARLERQALLTGGTRYTLHRGTQLFIYEAAEGVDLVAAVRRPRV